MCWRESHSCWRSCSALRYRGTHMFLMFILPFAQTTEWWMMSDSISILLPSLHSGQTFSLCQHIMATKKIPTPLKSPLCSIYWHLVVVLQIASKWAPFVSSSCTGTDRTTKSPLETLIVGFCRNMTFREDHFKATTQLFIVSLFIFHFLKLQIGPARCQENTQYARMLLNVAVTL